MQLCYDCSEQILCNCSQCYNQMCYNCFNYPLIGICSMYCMCAYAYCINYPIMDKDQQEKFEIIELNNKKTNVWIKMFLRKYMIGDLANIVLGLIE